MTPPLRISFIGGGNMAAALMSGFARLKDLPLAMHVVDRNPEKGAQLAARLGASCSITIRTEDLSADILVLAIKPQQLAEVATRLPGPLGQTLVISVAAGITTARLSDWLGGHRKLVRAMPNTPAQVGAGVTGLYACPEITALERERVGRLFESVGAALWLEDETRMDSLTAISGCGPAYVFYMIEALQAAAQEMGFSPADAALLAKGTFDGALRLLAASPGETPASLRAKVTSKKGATEQGLLSLEADNLFGLLARATRRAEARAIELGQPAEASGPAA